jgi:hypothetical protein
LRAVHCCMTRCMPKLLFCGLPGDRHDHHGRRIGCDIVLDDGTKSSRSRRITVKARCH